MGKKKVTSFIKIMGAILASAFKGIIAFIATIFSFMLSATCAGAGIFAFASGVFMLLPLPVEIVSSFAPIVVLFSGFSLISLGIVMICIFIKGIFYFRYQLGQIKKRVSLFFAY